MSNTVSIAALRPEVWAKETYKDVIDDLTFVRDGIMGTGTNNVIQIKEELSKSKGDTVTLGLFAKLGAAVRPITGDGEAEGNESAISSYSEAISIDQARFPVRLSGKLDEQKSAYNLRMEAKDKLSIQMKEFIERQIFLKAAGVTNTTLVDIDGSTVVAADCTWSNTPDYIPDADTAAGKGDRYLCADTDGADSLATTDLITPALISKARVKAMLASPKLIPLRVDGRNYYVMYVHPWQAYDLKRNAEFAQAQREAAVRGEKNPIFTGALGVWDGVIVREHEYVPFLDISVAGHSFRGAATGTNFTADACRALLFGAQAVGFVKCSTSWVEETFDYKNKVGFCIGLIGGIQKIMFNSKEYGVIAVDTAVTDLS